MQLDSDETGRERCSGGFQASGGAVPEKIATKYQTDIDAEWRSFDLVSQSWSFELRRRPKCTFPGAMDGRCSPKAPRAGDEERTVSLSTFARILSSTESNSVIDVKDADSANKLKSIEYCHRELTVRLHWAVCWEFRSTWKPPIGNRVGEVFA